MRQMKIRLGLGLRWICFTSFVFLIEEAVPLSERKIRQVTSSVCTAGCPPGHQVNEVCCEGGGPQCTESDFCEKCVDTTYSKGGRHDICQSCTICPANSDVLKPCTIESDAKCKCKLNHYKSPSEQCLHCSYCNEADYCKDVCSSVPPPPKNPSTTTDNPSTTTANDKVNPLTTDNVNTTSSKMVSSTADSKSKDEPFWKTLQFWLPIGFSPVLILAVCKLIHDAFCVQTKDSRECWTDHLPCCGNSPNKQSSDKVHAVQSEEKDPLLDHTDSNKSGPGSNGHNGASRTSKKHIPANLPVAPVSSQEFVLPEMCSNDTSRVTFEIIDDVSRLIGDNVKILAEELRVASGEVDNIIHAYKDDLEKQNYEVLRKWLIRGSGKATKKRLAEVLMKIGRAKETVKYIWPDLQPELVMPSSAAPTSPTPTSPTGIDWKGTDNVFSFSFESRVLHKKDWTKDKTWRSITQNFRKIVSIDFDKLIGACHFMRRELPKNEALKKCLSSKGNSDFKIDRYTIEVTVDINCIFSATSIKAFGSSEHCCKLVLLTVIELCCEKDYYLKQEALIQCMKAEYELKKTKGVDVFNDGTILALFQSCVRDTLEEHFSLTGNLIQLFGLASVLGCNIQSVYPAVDDTKQSTLNILITPRDKNIENLITCGVITEEEGEINVDNDAAKAAVLLEDKSKKINFSKDSSQLFQTELSEKEIIKDINAMDDKDYLCVPKYTVNKKELQTLIGSDWISDVVINAFLAILAFECNKQDKDCIFLLPTHIASTWHEAQLSPWMATKIAMSKFTWIFAPIHESGHWILLVAHIQSMSVCVLDSLNNDNDKHLENFRKYMKKRAVKTKELCGEWRKNTQLFSVQQSDGNSCGAFVMMNAWAISKRVFPDCLTQENAIKMRVLVMEKLLKKGESSRNCESCKGPISSNKGITCDVCGKWYHKNTDCTSSITSSTTEWECRACIDN